MATLSLQHLTVSRVAAYFFLFILWWQDHHYLISWKHGWIWIIIMFSGHWGQNSTHLFTRVKNKTKLVEKNQKILLLNLIRQVFQNEKNIHITICSMYWGSYWFFSDSHRVRKQCTDKISIYTLFFIIIMQKMTYKINLYIFPIKNNNYEHTTLYHNFIIISIWNNHNNHNLVTVINENENKLKVNKKNI